MHYTKMYGIFKVFVKYSLIVLTKAQIIFDIRVPINICLLRIESTSMFTRTNRNIRKYTFAGAVRAASGIGGAAAISTARRVTRHHEVGYSWLGIFRDVPQVTRLGNLSGLHERTGIRGASVRALTPRSAVLRMARRKPKKGYQATTRPSQETGTVQPGWPTLVMRLEKKVGNGGRT